MEIDQRLPDFIFPGVTVKLIDSWRDHRRNGYGVDGMDRWLGHEVTIRNVDGMVFCIEECPFWLWRIDAIDCVIDDVDTLVNSVDISDNKINEFLFG